MGFRPDGPFGFVGELAPRAALRLPWAIEFGPFRAENWKKAERGGEERGGEWDRGRRGEERRAECRVDAAAKLRELLAPGYSFTTWFF